MSSSPNGYGTTVGGTAAGIPSNGGHTDIAATGVELQLHAQPSHAHKRTRHCIGSDDAPSWACMSPHMDVERTSIEPFLTYQSSMLPPIVPMQTTLDSTMSTSSVLPTQTECPTPYENPLGFGPQGFDVFTSGEGYHGLNQDTTEMLADDGKEDHCNNPATTMFDTLKHEKDREISLPAYGAYQEEKERNTTVGRLRQRRNMVNLRVVVDELAPRAPGALATPSMMTHSPIRIMSSSFSAPPSTQGSPLY